MPDDWRPAAAIQAPRSCLLRALFQLPRLSQPVEAAIFAAALGWVPPWLAAIGMSTSSLLVVVNALRLIPATAKGVAKSRAEAAAPQRDTRAGTTAHGSP